MTKLLPKLLLLTMLFGARVYAESNDYRAKASFPEPLIEQTLEKMRGHLQQVTKIQEALGIGDFKKAANIAETGIALSSKENDLRGEGEATYAPKEMQELADLLHENAAKFAVEVRHISVNADAKPAILALSKVTQVCVACHAAYRLR